MALTSIAFAYFFLAILTAGWLLRRRRVARNGLLLAASYAFYASWDVQLVGWLLLLSLVDWAVAEGMWRVRAARARRALAALGVAANVGLLAALKLYDFFREALARAAQALGLESHLPVLELLAPVGLSFYAFQGIAYVVDTYRGTAVRSRSLLDFLLFMAFFPKLLAGPICRSHELLPQIAAPAPAAMPEPERAMALVFSGLAKKLVLAGYLSTHMVADVFQVPENHGWGALVVALAAYSAEIYLDFSGYTDLARGLALLLGFQLPENFRHPYAAANLGELWRRWHMTFSRWLRDYVYHPLGGSRRSRARTAVNLMATMLVCGLWHGASWGFVIWGALHGLGLVVHKLWRDWRRAGGDGEVAGQAAAAGAAAAARPARREAVFTALGCAGTLAFCALVRVFFRSEDLATALAYLGGLMNPRTGLAGVDPVVVAITALTLAMNFAGDRPFEAFVGLCQRLPRPVLPLCWATTGIALLALRTREMTPYIYFGF